MTGPACSAPRAAGASGPPCGLGLGNTAMILVRTSALLATQAAIDSQHGDENRG